MEAQGYALAQLLGGGFIEFIEREKSMLRPSTHRARCALLPLMLLLAACGRLSDATTGSEGSVVAVDMTGIGSKTPLGQATVLFTALPAADGTWTALVGGAGTEEPEGPCVGSHGSMGYEVAALRAGADPSPISAPEGRLYSGFWLGSLGRDVVVPPNPRVGDPIAVSAWVCDRSSEEGVRGSLLLGTIGEGGLPVGLISIAGMGAPEGAPATAPESGSAAISADRKTLVLVVDACPDPYNGPTGDCVATRWDYDLVTATWAQGDDPSYPRRGVAGQIWALSDGSLIEVIDGYDTGSSTTYRGTEIFSAGSPSSGYDQVTVDVAPDGQSALFNLLEYSTGYAKVVLLEAGGEPRTLYEREVASADDRYWGASFSAVFSGDGKSVYFDQPGASSWHVLWKMDIATGALTELVELPEVTDYTMLPDASGLIAFVDDGARWELWTFAKAG